jgi:PAS domain S-box-containing protein
MPSQTARTSPEQLYRLLADNATDAVTLHDLSGRYLYVSPSIRSFGGYLADDLIGRSCWELIHPDDIPAVQQAMTEAIVEGGIVTLEYRFRDVDGDYEWVETTARSVGDEIQCSSRNVTERRVAQAQQAAVARLGDFVMQRPTIDEMLEEATQAVSETLDVEIVGVIEHAEDGRDLLRAGVGWSDGFLDLSRPARILAVADIYEALTADRPYREAMPRERALEIVREQRGTGLCPAAVDALEAAATDTPPWTAGLAPIPSGADASVRPPVRRPA